MSELTKYNEPLAYTQQQIELIKNTVAKGATNDELAMFISIAKRYELDPFTKDIWFIKRAKKIKDRLGNWDYPRLQNGDIDYRDAETMIMTSRDGYLKIAQRDPNFGGIISFAVREGDIFEIDAENYKVSHKFSSKRGKIIGAWSKVDHKGRKPVIVYADFSEYYSDKSNIWKQYPTAMIQKVAEVLALKRQFGISGLVTQEEINYQAEELEVDQVIEDKPTYEIITPVDAKRLFSIAKGNAELVKEVIGRSGYDSTKLISKHDYGHICSEIEKLVVS